MTSGKPEAKQKVLTLDIKYFVLLNTVNTSYSRVDSTNSHFQQMFHNLYQQKKQQKHVNLWWSHSCDTGLGLNTTQSEADGQDMT